MEPWYQENLLQGTPLVARVSRRPHRLTAKLALERGILLGGVQEGADVIKRSLQIACAFEIGPGQSAGIGRRQPALCARVLPLEASHLDHVSAVGAAELAGVANGHVDGWPALRIARQGIGSLFAVASNLTQVTAPDGFTVWYGHELASVTRRH